MRTNCYYGVVWHQDGGDQGGGAAEQVSLEQSEEEVEKTIEKLKAKLEKFKNFLRLVKVEPSR